MKILSLAIASVLLFPFAFASADDDQANTTFDQGSVIIHCVAQSKGQQVNSDVFMKAFPQWVTSLQAHANEGRVGRAFYLSELKEGIFIVVLGDTAELAMQNAVAIHAENKEIVSKALKDSGLDESSNNIDDTCQFIEIGPIAILPQ